MKYAIQCLELQFDHLMVLSEADYPLQSTLKIKQLLSKYKGKTLMRKLKALKPQKITPFLQDIYCECDNLLYHVGRRVINERNEIIIYSSSVWATYDYQFIKYIVEDDEMVPDYIDFFRPTAVADETFFATVLMNSPLCNHYVDDLNWYEWRLELWPFINTDKQLLPCKHAKSNTAFCGIGPIDIISEYLPVLQATKAFFARKFNPNKDMRVLDIIDEWKNDSNSKPGLYDDLRLIKIGKDDQCLSVYDNELDVEECDENDDAQIFMLYGFFVKWHLE